MPFTIPDQGEGSNDRQSILFQEDLDIVVAGLAGRDCVLDGCAVTTAGTNLTLDVARGSVLSNAVMFAVAAGTTTLAAADGTNPRIDLVVINSAGAIANRTGTAAANPLPPVRSANDVVLAMVDVPANDTAIASNQIVDKRVNPKYPVVIYRQTAADTVNTSAAAIELLNRTNSGVTIPRSLFNAGRILRLRMGGHWLANSGTPTCRLVIAYGGTTMFSDISAATTLDADRKPYFIDVDIVAQGNADQSLNGHTNLSLIAGITNPTTGRGDAWSTALAAAAINGDAAVDSDAANRLLSVQWTFSVSNVANEITTEYATLELL